MEESLRSSSAIRIDREGAGAEVSLNSKPRRSRPRTNQEVELGPLMGRPEVAFLRAGPQSPHHLRDRKALPRRADPRVTLEGENAPGS